MLHARDDYNRIQDPAGKIPDDEPVFLIRAQDKTAADVVRYWAELQFEEGGDNRLGMMAMAQVGRILAWQEKHGCKRADL